MSALEVRRPGGVLHVHELAQGTDAGSATVVVLHGITANALSWTAAAEHLCGRLGSPVRVLAPDLRGRADSRAFDGPWGLGSHADDVAAIIDAAGAHPAYLVGHSMGGFIAALTAARHAAQVAGVVLVDGGLAFPPPPDLDIDAALTAVIGPAMKRLSMRFADEVAYLDFWADHPAVGPLLRGPSAQAVRGYLLHDLVRDGEALVSSCVLDAVRTDGGDVLSDAETHAAVTSAARQGVALELVWAARGLMDEPQGLYDESRLEALDIPETVRVVGVPEANHYSVILEEPGLNAIAAALQRLRG